MSPLNISSTLLTVGCCSHSFLVLLVIGPGAAEDPAGLRDAIETQMRAGHAGLQTCACGEGAVLVAMEAARALHLQLHALMQTAFCESNPIPVKAALAMMGKIEYELRLPLCRMSEKNEGTLKKVMQDYGLIG